MISSTDALNRRFYSGDISVLPLLYLWSIWWLKSQYYFYAIQSFHVICTISFLASHVFWFYDRIMYEINPIHDIAVWGESMLIKNCICRPHRLLEIFPSIVCYHQMRYFSMSASMNVSELGGSVWPWYCKLPWLCDYYPIVLRKPWPISWICDLF